MFPCLLLLNPVCLWIKGYKVLIALRSVRAKSYITFTDFDASSKAHSKHCNTNFIKSSNKPLNMSLLCTFKEK